VSDGPERLGPFDPFAGTGGWPQRESAAWPAEEERAVEQESDRDAPAPAGEQALAAGADEALAVAAPEATPETEEGPVPEPQAAPEPAVEPAAPPEHATGELRIPDGFDLVEGGPHGFRRTVAVVVSRFNGDITSRMLDSALQALTECHVAKEQITIVPVPGAFELPLAALALAKTRRFSCVVALGCVIRGETPHFDYIASEAASGLQLAAIETGIPVSFGLLTCETREQAEARVGRGAVAARTALEMADLFAHVRTRAAAAR